VMRESNVENLASFHVIGIEVPHEHEYHFSLTLLHDFMYFQFLSHSI
jgi:hypothetical protein